MLNKCNDYNGECQDGEGSCEMEHGNFLHPFHVVLLLKKYVPTLPTYIQMQNKLLAFWEKSICLNVSMAAVNFEVAWMYADCSIKWEIVV